MDRQERVIAEQGMAEAEARRQHTGRYGDVGPDPEKADLLAALLDHAQCKAGSLGLHEIAYEMAMSRELGPKVVNGAHGFSILVPNAAGIRSNYRIFLITGSYHNKRSPARTAPLHRSRRKRGSGAARGCRLATGDGDLPRPNSGNEKKRLMSD